MVLHTCGDQKVTKNHELEQVTVNIEDAYGENYSINKNRTRKL